MINDDIELHFSTKHLPFEYKLLEFRLNVNKKLYDDKIIDFRIFNEMENSIMGRLLKIKNEYNSNPKNDLTRLSIDGSIQST